MKKYIDEIIKPKVQADGGEIDFVSLENDTLTLLLQGECSVCGVADKCLHSWIESEIKRDLNKIVKIKFIKKAPYFREV